MSIREIKKRWDERIVPNNWDKMGYDGAKSYMDKFGKGMGNEKKKELADYADSMGCKEFACYMRDTIVLFRIASYEEAEKNNWNYDSLDEFNEAKYEDEIAFLIESTAEELGKRGIGVFCSDGRGNCFKEIAKKYPDIRIRGCWYIKENNMGCVDIKIENEKMGEEISDLANLGGGTLRCDYAKPGWTYFETE